MEYESLAAGEQTMGQTAHTEIELLARETRVPLEIVATIYTSERNKLERTARIKTYVPVLIHRRVKALLRERHLA